MGCDIHFYIETRKSSKHKWSTKPFHTLEKEEGEKPYLPDLSTGRDYYMFGLMAGVRRGEPLFEPRGVPDDVSSSVRKQIDIWDGDGHTHSWLTLNEFEECINTYEKNYEHSPGNKWLNILNQAKEWLTNTVVESQLLGDGKDTSDLRFVFFFDN